MAAQVLLFITGIVFLYAGGMIFINGASRTALVFNIKPVIIGVVVIAFATSAPEFFVSVLAAAQGRHSLAVGNVLGSNICNIGLVLGISIIARPISMHNSALNREVPILLVSSLLLFVICLDLVISRFEALILLSAFSGFIFYCVKNAKDSEQAAKQLIPKANQTTAFAFLAGGIAGLLAGAYMVVVSAVSLARYLGVNEIIIGLTIVAIGTSLPELFASVSASLQKQGDMSIGNVIGSNIFNILAIIGAAALIRPIALPVSVISFDFPVLIFYSIAVAVIVKKGYTIQRVKGLAFLLSYAVYLWITLKV